MKKADIIKDLETNKGILSFHGTWALYSVKDDGSLGTAYAGRINPKTAQELIAQNPSWGSAFSAWKNNQ